MTKRMTLMLLAVAVVFGGIFGFKAFVNTQMQAYFDNQPIPPATVSTAQAQTMRWAEEITAVGTVVADQSVALSAEVTGRVTAIAFQSGDIVEAGQVLVELDSELDTADLNALQAQLQLARSEYDRIAALYKQQRVSKSERDAAQSQRDALAAQVASRTAALAKKTIRAPFAGRLGIRRINLGQVLSAGTEIVRLSALEPLHVDFSLPAQQAARVGDDVEVKVEVAGVDSALSAQLSAVESEIDRSTRNLNLRVTLDQAPQNLRPGAFADLTLVLPQSANRVVVPQAAVTFNPYGDTVFVVNPPQEEGAKPTAEQRFIRTGDARGDFVVVLEGLSEGEDVVTSGQLKVRNGGSLVIDNDNAPQAQLQPQPQNS